MPKATAPKEEYTAPPAETRGGSSALTLLVMILAIAAAGFGLMTYVQSQSANRESDRLKQELADVQQQKAALETDAQKNAQAAEDAKKMADEKAQQAAAALAAVYGTPAGWASTTIKELNMTFSYPKEWGTATTTAQVQTATSTAGTVYIVSFDKAPNYQLGFVTKDYKGAKPNFILDLMKSDKPMACKVEGRTTACETIVKDGGQTLVLFAMNADAKDPIETRATAGGVLTTGNEKYPSLFLVTHKPDSATLDTVKRVLYSVK